MQPNIALEPAQPLSFVTLSQRCAAQRQALCGRWSRERRLRST